MLGTAPARFGLASLVRGVPRLVWAVVALHVLVLVCYTVVVPTFRAPDEELHTDLVLMVRDMYAGEQPFEWPAVTERHIADRVHASLLYLRFPEGPHRQTVGQAALRGDRPSFDDLGSAEEVTGLSHNQVVQHPPTYYALAAAWLAVAPGSGEWPFDRQVAYLRLLSVLLLAPLPLLLYAAGWLVSRRRQVAVAAAIAGVAVPQLSYMGAVVNNDSLLILGGALLTVPLLHVARGDLSVRTSAWTGVFFGVALAAKGLALALVPWVAVAYLVGWRRRGGRLPWRAALVVTGVALLAGGWWWLRKLALVGAVHVRGTVYDTDPLASPELWLWTREFTAGLLESWWGSFVWADAMLPFPFVLLPAAVLAAGVVAAFWKPSPRQGVRVDCGLLVLPSVLLLGLAAWASYTTYARSGAIVGTQGRYLFPGFVGLVAVVAFGHARVVGRHGRWLPAGLLAAAGVLQLLAVVHMLVSYWDLDVAGPVAAVLAVMAWSPWSGWAMAALGLATAVGAVTVAVGAVTSGRAPPAEDSDEAPA